MEQPASTWKMQTAEQDARVPKKAVLVGACKAESRQKEANNLLSIAPVKPTAHVE